MNLRWLNPSCALELGDIGRCAVQSLKMEVATWPKPGLVSHIDQGSHADMDGLT